MHIAGVFAKNAMLSLFKGRIALLEKEKIKSSFIVLNVTV